MVNKLLVRRKLQLIAEELGRLLTFQNISLDELKQDFIRQAAVERILERIVQRALDVNAHLIVELARGRRKDHAPHVQRHVPAASGARGVFPRVCESSDRSAGLNVLLRDCRCGAHSPSTERIR